MGQVLQEGGGQETFQCQRITVQNRSATRETTHQHWRKKWTSQTYVSWGFWCENRVGVCQHGAPTLLNGLCQHALPTLMSVWHVRESVQWSCYRDSLVLTQQRESIKYSDDAWNIEIRYSRQRSLPSCFMSLLGSSTSITRIKNIPSSCKLA